MEEHQLREESDRYFEAHIVDECNCEDCCADNFAKVQEDIFERFGIPFIPYSFQNNDFELGSNKSNFSYFWSELYRIQRYNRKQEIKRDESGTNKSLVHCIQCGKLTYKNKNRNYKDEQLCIVCARLYKECHYCNELVNTHIDSVYTIRFEDTDEIIYACRDCYGKHKMADHKCSSCNSYHKDLTTMKKIANKRDNNDEIQYYNYCKRCGISIKKCSVFGCNEFTFAGQSKCNACIEEDHGLQTYDFKPMRRVFHYSTNEKNINKETSLFLGFELETEAANSSVGRETMAHLVKQVVGKDCVYCMKDGSLYNGIEIASFPFTWDWYKKVGKDKWTELLLFLKDKGWRGDLPGEGHPNSVGFHVHTTKAAWSNLQVYKLIQFVYNPTNRKVMDIIAGRKPMTYCVISHEDFDRSVMLAKDKKNVSKNHYNMINLNKKSNTNEGGKTIEFRMFKGSVEPLIVHKNLEFIKAIFEFTKDHSKKEMLDFKFAKFIAKNKKEYPCLFEYLNTQAYAKSLINY